MSDLVQINFYGKRIYMIGHVFIESDKKSKWQFNKKKLNAIHLFIYNLFGS